MTFVVRHAVILVVVAASLAACETSVDPFQETGYYFSIGGIVDASADTQFVRISPLRRSAIPPVELSGVTVTSIDLQTGADGTWQDSLFYTFPDGLAHNFWSTFDFEPGKRYRLTVRDEEGNESSVAFSLPDSFPDPVVQQSITQPLPILNVYDVDRLADLRILYCGRTENNAIRRVEAPLVQDVSKFTGGYTITLDPYALASELHLREVLWMRIYAAAASSDWPDFAEIDEETLAHPHSVSNVESGVGFLGGVTSKLVDWPGSVPQESICLDLLRRW